MSYCSKGKNKKHWRPSGRRGSFFKPFLELLEDRCLLSVGATLQGTVVDDSNHDTPLSGAKVALYQQQGANFVPTGQSVTTGANGRYSFTVAPGTYRLIEIPPSGYTNDSTHITPSPLETASQISPSTIQVTVPQTAQVSIDGNEFQFPQGTLNPPPGSGIAPVEVLSYNINGDSINSFYVGQLIATLNGTTYNTFCVDLTSFILINTANVYTVTPQTDLTGIGGANVQTGHSGEIAYLYDTFGTGTLPSVNAAALQVAIWSLEYNAMPLDFDSTTQTIPAGNFFYLTGPNNFISSSTYQAVVAQVTTYLNEGAGHSGLASFLAPVVPPAPGSSGGQQAILAPPGNYNFSDVPKATPNITTTQQPAIAIVGSSIRDTATVTGLVNAQSGGTVTFNLYSSATVQNSSTLLFTDTETVTLSPSGTSATATSKFYTTIATGTDYWVATYNGDRNNRSVTSSPTAEPVILLPPPPPPPPPPSPPPTNVSTGTINVMLTADQVSKRSFLSSSDPPLNPAMLAAEEQMFNTWMSMWANLWGALWSEAASKLSAR